MKIYSLALSMLAFAAVAFSSGAEAAENRTSLNGKDWSLSFWKQPSVPVTSPEQIKLADVRTIEATVPGNVELDLFNAGIIGDPMVGNNVNDLREWEGYQWCYTKTFPSPSLKEGEKCRLLFGGIDCLAEIWVNGKHVGSCNNMLIDHSYDVTDVLNESGTNTLQVIIRSAVIESQDKFLGVFSIGNFASEEGAYIRKAAHMYGWDILPRLVSAGLWRDVDIEIVKPARFVDVHYMTASVDTASSRARLYVQTQLKMPFDKFDKAKMVLMLRRDGKVKYKRETIVNTPQFLTAMDLENVDLWWPRGYGEPALYEAVAELVDSDGTVLATDRKMVGIRIVALERNDINLPEEPGKFCFIINGERIFVRGTNWVPIDALHSRDASLLDDIFKNMVDVNCNMIRCWGGSVYEDHAFFDLCDRNGILVWQDFAMGCNFYPQRDDFINMLEEEVTSIVVKLRNHPSLALWSGNNEDDIALLEGNYRPFKIDPNKDAVSRGIIPRVLYEFDPTRPYLPSSPYFSERVYETGIDEKYLPENHLWGPRGYYKDPFYTNITCAFVSEIGYHGCPNRESLEKMMTEDCVYPWEKDFDWNDEWVTKSVRRFPSWGKTYDRNNLMINQIRHVFGDVPKDLDKFIFASQSVQAEAMKYFIEIWRSRKGEKNGIIWWNLRDGWPLISDAVTDYYNSRKQAYYFIRNVQKDVCVMINDAVDGAHPLVVANDTRKAAEGHVTVVDVATGKTLLSSGFAVGKNAKSEFGRLPVLKGTGIMLIMYDVNGTKQMNHYLYGEAPYSLEEYGKLLEKADNILKKNGYNETLSRH